VATKPTPKDTATAQLTQAKTPGEAAGGELYPTTAERHAELLDWFMEQWNAADRARAPLTQRWRRFWKLYRSHVIRQKGDWRSKVFIPIAFYVIEAVIPRIMAQLPNFLVEPVGPEDEEGAKVMEKLLRWSATRSRLEAELIKVYRSALKYGTGIAKVRHDHRTKMQGQMVPEMASSMMPGAPMPVIDPETGEEMMGLDGQPLMDTAEQELTEQPTGRMVRAVSERVVYDGPVCEYVSIFNFWPAPEATSIEDARFVIQRTFRDDKYVKRMIEEGLWRMPPGMEFSDFWQNQKDDLESLREETDNAATDPTRKMAEVFECWTNDTLMVVLNRRAVVRVEDNPYEHGEKPFVRITDYFQEGEFWGIGEIEPLEGLQDLTNALWNQRVDNVRLVLNRMVAFDPDNIVDPRDLQNRPGGMIRVRSRDMPVGQVIQPVEIPDVTSSSYTEVAEIERMTEKISGVSGYTTGTDSPTMNRTATGVSIITEQSNTRFATKVRMAEMTGLASLARMYGSILQQFMPEEMSLRVLNDEGQQVWATVTAESIQGGFDYTIEVESSTVTESVRKEQSMNLIQTFAQIIDPATGMPVLNLNALAQDVLEAFGKKNMQRYAPLPPPPPMPMEGMEEEVGPDPNEDPNALMDAMAAMGQNGGGPPPV
jgi:hypothetical protein